MPRALIVFNIRFRFVFKVMGRLLAENERHNPAIIGKDCSSLKPTQEVGKDVPEHMNGTVTKGKSLYIM